MSKTFLVVQIVHHKLDQLSARLVARTAQLNFFNGVLIHRTNFLTETQNKFREYQYFLFGKQF